MEAALAEVAVPIACRSRWAGGLRLDRVGVDVLEELEATVAVCRLASGVWRLEHGDVGVVAVQTDGGVGPLSTDGVTAKDGQTEVSEEGDRRFEVADGDADVLEFDGHALHATESGRFIEVPGLPISISPSPRTRRKIIVASVRHKTAWRRAEQAKREALSISGRYRTGARPARPSLPTPSPRCGTTSRP
jgi:hypothetical protein